MLELHGLDPAICAENKFKTPTIAYEATHGYSDQFIVEYDVFLKCAKAAGLKKDNIYSKVTWCPLTEQDKLKQSVK